MLIFLWCCYTGSSIWRRDQLNGFNTSKVVEELYRRWWQCGSCWGLMGWFASFSDFGSGTAQKMRRLWAFCMPYWHHADIAAFCPIGDGLPIGSHRSDCGNWLVPESVCLFHIVVPFFTARRSCFWDLRKVQIWSRSCAGPGIHQVFPPKCELQTSTETFRKMLKRERDWRTGGFRLGPAQFSSRGKCKITCLAGLWHSPSGRPWSGRGLLELCFCVFHCNFRTFCWNSCNRTWMLT